jgi:hypothetical protein
MYDYQRGERPSGLGLSDHGEDEKMHCNNLESNQRV